MELQPAKSSSLFVQMPLSIASECFNCLIAVLSGTLR
jgi:hypothetical protein